MLRIILFSFCLLASLTSSAQSPDFSQLTAWAAHPKKVDPADELLVAGLVNVQDTSQVDVFFIYPTMYQGKNFKRTTSNARLDHAALNEEILTKPIKFQASAFNGVGKVYAPFYRQAHIDYYWDKDMVAAKNAFDTAYNDVVAAFKHYINYENKGRRFIIAGHSQGTTHAIRLIKEELDGKPLSQQLIVAYLIGMPVLKNEYKTIQPCQSPDQTGCFCTWRTFSQGNEPPKNWKTGPEIAVTNPLDWSTSMQLVPAQQNLGGIDSKSRLYPKMVSAQVNPDLGILWCSRPKIRGARLIKNYHAGDINLYYMNIRQNARLRAGYKI
jgi:Protein of unknown function (DUF3089)